jgi:hypothetical protein
MMDADMDARISFDEFVKGYERVWATKVRHGFLTREEGLRCLGLLRSVT